MPKDSECTLRSEVKAKRSQELQINEQVQEPSASQAATSHWHDRGRRQHLGDRKLRVGRSFPGLPSSVHCSREGAGYGAASVLLIAPKATTALSAVVGVATS